VRLFLDSSVLIAADVSAEGASREVFHSAEAGPAFDHDALRGCRSHQESGRLRCPGDG